MGCELYLWTLKKLLKMVYLTQVCTLWNFVSRVLYTTGLFKQCETRSKSTQLWENLLLLGISASYWGHCCTYWISISKAKEQPLFWLSQAGTPRLPEGFDYQLVSILSQMLELKRSFLCKTFLALLYSKLGSCAMQLLWTVATPTALIKRKVIIMFYSGEDAGC